MTPVRSARQALGFLTILGSAATPTAAALMWFPVVGALIGAAVGGLWWAASSWFPVLVAAALAVIADLAITGMLHVDGLADSADGLLAPMHRERRLAVMSDPRAGAFVTIAVVAVMLVRFAVFASLAPSWRMVVAVAAVWSVARTVMAAAACLVPYARPAGLATAFLGGSARPIIAIGAVVAVALAVLGSGGSIELGLAVLSAVLAGAAVIAFAVDRIGGFTGDVLGAAGVIAETVGLLVLTVTR